VLTAKKYNDVVPGHANMIEFKLEKNEFQLIDIAADSTSISCLNKDNKEVTVVVDPEVVRLRFPLASRSTRGSFGGARAHCWCGCGAVCRRWCLN
jgi:hypothetical protein